MFLLFYSLHCSAFQPSLNLLFHFGFSSSPLADLEQDLKLQCGYPILSASLCAINCRLISWFSSRMAEIVTDFRDSFSCCHNWTQCPAQCFIPLPIHLTHPPTFSSLFLLPSLPRLSIVLFCDGTRAHHHSTITSPLFFVSDFIKFLLLLGQSPLMLYSLSCPQ